MPSSPSTENAAPSSVSVIPSSLTLPSSKPHFAPATPLDSYESSDSEEETNELDVQNNNAGEPHDDGPNLDTEFAPQLLPQQLTASPPANPDVISPYVTPTPPRLNQSYHFRTRQHLHNASPAHGNTNSVMGVPSPVNTDDTQAAAADQKTLSAEVRPDRVAPDVSTLRKGDTLLVKLPNSSSFFLALC